MTTQKKALARVAELEKAAAHNVRRIKALIAASNDLDAYLIKQGVEAPYGTLLSGVKQLVCRLKGEG